MSKKVIISLLFTLISLTINCLQSMQHKQYGSLSMLRTNKNKEYTLIAPLGKGAYGVVYKAVDNDGKTFAIKKISRYKHNPHLTHNENERERIKYQQKIDDALKGYTIMTNIQHWGVAQVYEITESQNSYYIIMEYVEGHSLSTIQKYIQTGISEHRLALIAIQLIATLTFLHQRGLFHRDIKLCNIIMLTDNWRIKLVDFDFVAQAAKPDNQITCGTPYFMPPEMIQRKPYDTKCDIWSAGVTLYVLATTRQPFKGYNLQETQNNIVSQLMPPPFATPHSREMEDFIATMMTKDQTSRPSALELLKNSFGDIALRWFLLCIPYLTQDPEVQYDMLTQLVEHLDVTDDGQQLFNEQVWQRATQQAHDEVTLARCLFLSDEIVKTTIEHLRSMLIGSSHDGNELTSTEDSELARRFEALKISRVPQSLTA